MSRSRAYATRLTTSENPRAASFVVIVDIDLSFTFVCPVGALEPLRRPAERVPALEMLGLCCSGAGTKATDRVEAPVGHFLVQTLLHEISTGEWFLGHGSQGNHPL